MTLALSDKLLSNIHIQNKSFTKNANLLSTTSDVVQNVLGGDYDTKHFDIIKIISFVQNHKNSDIKETS